MPVNVVKPGQEKDWTRAKAAAAKQGQAKNYRLIMHIFQQMTKAEDEPEEGEARPMPIPGIPAKEVAKSDKKIREFLKQNPSPDDSEVHALAGRLGMEVDDVEESIYRMAAKKIKKSEKVEPISAIQLKALIKRYDGQVIPGGKAAKHKPGDFDVKQLRLGVAVELEHTPDLLKALEIAMDHLVEDPKYYSHLLKMEEKYAKAITPRHEVALGRMEATAGKLEALRAKRAQRPPPGHSAHAAQIGEVHDWGKGRFRKVAPGKWEPVGGGAQPGAQQAPAGAEPPQEGTSEHHRGQAMVHMQAAMAHATAHQSAVQQEEGAKHEENVKEAKEASQEAADGREGRPAEPQSLEDQIKALMEQHGEEAVAAAANKATKAVAGKLDKAFQAEAKKVSAKPAVKTAAEDAVAAVGIRKGGEAPSKEKQAEAAKRAAQDPNVKKAARDAMKGMEEPAAKALAEGIEAAAPPEEKKKVGWKTKLAAVAKMMIRPFVFGFVDNFVMYIAGSAVDGAVQGAGFGPAATAGIGNAISDAVGETAGGALERVLPSEEKLKAQLGTETYERMEKYLQPLGVFTGALLGMIPLAFGIGFGKSMKREADIMKARAKAAPGQLGFGFGEGAKPAEKPKGPFIGPRGGKYANPEHTIPWRENPAHHKERKEKHKNAKKVHAEMAARESLPADVRAAHKEAWRGHHSAYLAHSADAEGLERHGGAPADLISGAARMLSEHAMKLTIPHVKKPKPKAKPKGGTVRAELPEKPEPLERPRPADRPPGTRARATAPKRVKQPIAQPGSGAHLQFSMKEDTDMEKANIQALATRVMGGAKLDDVMEQVQGDENKRALLTELRERKSKARKSVAVSDRDELRKGFLSVAELRKGFYNRATEWADQFYGTPLAVEALQLLKERIKGNKDADAERAKHKTWRELEEMPRSKRQEIRKKQEAVMDKHYKKQEALEARQSSLEEKLLDHKIAQAQAMGKATPIPIPGGGPVVKTMTTKEGKELHFKELEAKIRAAGGAADPGAVAATVYRRAGGTPSPRKTEKGGAVEQGLEQLFKAEGERGGKVVGHTAGGKAIYAQHLKSAQKHDQKAKAARARGSGFSASSEALAHERAAKAHRTAAEAHAQGAEGAGEASMRAHTASRNAHKTGTMSVAKSGVEQGLEQLFKAMQPAGGKDPTLMKPKPKPGEEEEENGPGSSEHHKDQAMSHLVAAQAHATAHRSAKQVESGGEHKENVTAAQQASEAAAPPEEEKPMKQQPRPKAIKKGGMVIHLDAEDEILAGLGESGLSIQGSAADPYGRHRMAAMGRGDADPAVRDATMTKGGVAGGTIYQGEHDVQGSRPGDSREDYMRAQELAGVVEQDPAGHGGQGGLPDWWRDAGHLVTMPAGSTRPIVKAVEPPVQILDDSEPLTRAMSRTDPREGQTGALMAYKGAGKGRGTL